MRGREEKQNIGEQRKAEAMFIVKHILQAMR